MGPRRTLRRPKTTRNREVIFRGDGGSFDRYSSFGRHAIELFQNLIETYGIYRCFRHEKINPRVNRF